MSNITPRKPGNSLMKIDTPTKMVVAGGVGVVGTIVAVHVLMAIFHVVFGVAMFPLHHPILTLGAGAGAYALKKKADAS